MKNIHGNFGLVIYFHVPKRIKTRSATEGNESLSFHEDVERDFVSIDISLEDLFCNECDYNELRSALNNLNKEEYTHKIQG